MKGWEDVLWGVCVWGDEKGLHEGEKVLTVYGTFGLSRERGNDAFE